MTSHIGMVLYVYVVVVVSIESEAGKSSNNANSCVGISLPLFVGSILIGSEK